MVLVADEYAKHGKGQSSEQQRLTYLTNKPLGQGGQ